MQIPTRRTLLAEQLVLDPRDVQEMSHEEIYVHMNNTRASIDTLMSEYFLLHCAAARFEGECLPETIHLTEFLTVCAWQTFNERGQRGGDVRILLRDGSMPTYIARGMLDSATKYIDNKMLMCSCEEDDSDGGS